MTNNIIVALIIVEFGCLAGLYVALNICDQIKSDILAFIVYCGLVLCGLLIGCYIANLI